jgi:hypothetical protein
MSDALHKYRVGDRVRAVDCDWVGFGVVKKVYRAKSSEGPWYDVQWDEDVEGMCGSHTARWLAPAPGVPGRYWVIKLEDGLYFSDASEVDHLGYFRRHCTAFYRGNAQSFSTLKAARRVKRCLPGGAIMRVRRVPKSSERHSDGDQGPTSARNE